MIPDMGYHFMNPKVTGFNPRQAADPRLPEARRHVAARRDRVGVHVQACEAAAPGRQLRRVRRRLPLQGRLVRPGRVAGLVPEDGAGLGAAFNFWHPNLITLHVWLWYPNPSGLYSGTNPLVRPFN